MAARFWVGGTGTWDGSATTHWSATSGGASGASAPTSSDTATFDVNSGLNSGGTVTVTAAAACGGLTISGLTNTVANIVTFSFSGDPTWSAGTYSFVGSGQGLTLQLISSTLSTQRTLTINGTHGTHTDLFFNDVAIAGTAGALSGTRISDGLGNSGITFTTSATQTFVGGTKNWSDPTAWTSRVPLAQDDVIVNTTTAGTLTGNTFVLGRSVDFTSFTRTFNLTRSVGVYGNLTLASAMTFTGDQTFTFAGRSAYTITSNGKAFPGTVTIAAPGGTYTLQDAFSLPANRQLTLNNGTFHGNGQTVSCGIFVSTSGATRSVLLGGGTWSLTRTGTATVWNVTADLTVTPSTSTIDITSTDSGVTKTFAGAGLTYFALRHTSTGSAALTITGSNTFATLDLECTTARTVTFPASGTQTVTGALTTQGASGQLLSLVSSSGGTATTIRLPAGATHTASFISKSSDVLIARELPAAATSGSSAVSVTFSRIRARTASVSGRSTVTATVTRIRARTASVSGKSTVTASVVRLRARTASVSGRSTVSASLGRLRVRSASISGFSTVSATLVYEVQGFAVAFAADPLDFNPRWSRVDHGVSGVSVTGWTIDRGRTDELQKTGTGTAEIRMVDANGVFDPTNASGPYYGQLDPMKQVALALQNPVTGVWTTLFQGYLAELTYELDISETFASVTLSCVDAFDFLSGLEMTPGAFGAAVPTGSEGDISFVADPLLTATQTRIQGALTDAGWSTDLREIFTGNVGLKQTIYARRDQLLTVLQDTADAEFPDIANIYVSKDGKITYHGRYARFNPEDADYHISIWKAGDVAAHAADSTYALISGLAFSRGRDKIINAALALPMDVDDADVAGNLSEDAPSIAAYSRRSLSFENLLTANGEGGTTDVEETRLFAEFFTDNYASPRDRVNRIRFTSQDPNGPYGTKAWAVICGLELNDIIRLATTHPGGGGFDEDLFVDRLRYEASPLQPGYPAVEVEVDVSPRSYYAVSPFAGGSG